MKHIDNDYSIFGWPLFLMVFGAFLLNLVLCRMITASLIKQRYIKSKSPEFQKAFIMWFFPIVGFAGLLMLLLTHKLIKFLKSLSKWMLLKHI